MFDEAVVEERDPNVLGVVEVEDVIARVRVAVERAEAVERSKDEPEDGLGCTVADGLGLFHQIGPRTADHEIGRDDTRRAEVCMDARNVNEGMVGVEVGELLLIFRLTGVVELLGEAFLDFGDQLIGFECLESECENCAEQVGVFQVGRNRIGDAGVLHLHCDCVLFAGRGIDDDRAVNLPNRGRRNRFVVPVDEQLVDW